jgi:hypothetical protein
MSIQITSSGRANASRLRQIAVFLSVPAWILFVAVVVLSLVADRNYWDWIFNFVYLPFLVSCCVCSPLSLMLFPVLRRDMTATVKVVWFLAAILPTLFGLQVFIRGLHIAVTNGHL